MNSKMIKGYVMIIVSAVIYGCMPLMAKYIYADGVNPTTLVLLRNLLALPSLAILSYMKDKTLKISPKILPQISVLSFFGCCITPLLLFTSYNYMASGSATVIHFIYPALVVVGSILIGEKANLVRISSVVICIVGISMFYDTTHSASLTGILFALTSGITFAIYVIMLSRFKHRKDTGFRFSLYIASASAVIMLIYASFTQSLMLPKTLLGWVLCAFFAFAVTTGAVVLFQQGTFLIGGERASILSTLEPITSVIIGITVFSEPLSARTVIGSVLVVLASILIALSDIKKSN